MPTHRPAFCAYLRLLCLATALALSACALPPPGPPLATHQVLTTVRGAQLHGTLVDLTTQRVVPWETFIATLPPYQVVAFGEEHYHPDIQAFALRLLQALVQATPQPIILAMEFLERDMQPAVDAYLAGQSDATAFQAAMKATPDFVQYYMPLLHYARQTGLSVRAMNAPRTLARRVTKEGLAEVLASLTLAEQASVATLLTPASPAYRAYFTRAAAASHPLPAEQLARFIDAAFLKDETMAESLATALAQTPQATVLAIAGRFHSDYGLAIPASLRQRLPAVRLVRVTTIAVGAQETVDVRQLATEGLAEYVWFAPPAPERPK